MSSEEEKRPKEKRKARWCKRGKYLLYVLAIYSLISLIYSLIPEGRLEVKFLQEKKAIIQGPLLAGFARTELTPKSHLWEKLNIYGQKPPIAGVHDPLYARALVLSSPKSQGRIAIVSCDLLIITRDLKEAVLKKLKKRIGSETQLLLTASHTHSGPGNYWDNKIGQMALGKYRPEFFNFLTERIAQSIELAAQTSLPAQMGYAKKEVRGPFQESPGQRPGIRYALPNRY